MSLDLTTVAGWVSTAIGSGAVLQFIDKRLAARKAKSDENKDLSEFQIKLREELHKDSSVLRSRLDEVEKECDVWRDRYYEQLAQLVPLRGEIKALTETTVYLEGKIARMEASELRRNPPPQAR